MSLLWIVALVGCSDYALNAPPGQNELPPNGVDTLTGGQPARDTDADGTADSDDLDADGDGVGNDLDPDPDGDGVPGWTLDANPADDPQIDLESGLPALGDGDVRGRICAPNGSTWVTGAEVTIVTGMGVFQTTTNGDGWFQLTDLPPGEHTVIVTKGSFATTFEVTVEEGTTSDVVYDECLVQGELKIAVVTGEYDSIGQVLDHLGLVFDNVNGVNDGSANDFLLDTARMSTYDMIFFNCGMSFDWLDEEDEADGIEAQVATNLRQFAENGGSIYASDWAYLIVEKPFPEMLTFMGDDAVPGSAFLGVEGEIEALVVDTAMANLLGGNLASINYDLNIWVAMQAAGPGVDILLEGDFPVFDENDQPVPASGPLATRFSYGAGNVTYTTFHNEVQTTIDMEHLLEDIVLSL
jgi:hypothetical protein